MIKKLPLALLLCLFALPVQAQWNSDAVQALPYVYHEQELKADIGALDAALKTITLQRLRDYYLAEVNKLPLIAQTYTAPLIFDDLSGNYVTLYQDTQNDFLRSVDDGEDDLLSRLERDERQAHRNELSSSDMVALKNFYLAQPAFFDLPLSFNNTQRFANDVETEPKHDLPERQALARSLAGVLRLQDTRYVIEGDALHAIPPDVVEKNLTASLSNTFTAPQLQSMLDFADSDTGHAFLAMKERAFANRFLSLQEVYRRALAQAVDSLRAKIVQLPPLVYPVQRLRHHRRHHDDN